MTTANMEKLRATFADVIQKHNEASGDYDLLHSQWVEAAAKGDDARADGLEIEIERTRRLVLRLELRRDALVQEIGSGEEVERATHAAKLKQTCDSVLARATKRIADSAPLAATLAKSVDALEADVLDWTEARHHAKSAGANPESFSTLENEALVRGIFDSLTLSKTRLANLAKRLSQLSVFH
jgi:hypothetical protein